MWEYPDEACTGHYVEQLRQPREGEKVSTRGYGWYGISALGQGSTIPYGQAPDDQFHFPDAICIEGIRYGLAGWTHPGWKYVKDDESQREDLPGEFFGRPWLNSEW